MLDIVTILNREQEELLNKIKAKLSGSDRELVLKLEVVMNMKEKYSTLSNEATVKVEAATVTITKKYKAVQLFKKLFNENPDTEYTIPQLREYLNGFDRRGELLSRSKSVSTTVYSALRVLEERQKFIERLPDTAEIIYRKKEKGLLTLE